MGGRWGRWASGWQIYVARGLARVLLVAFVMRAVGAMSLLRDSDLTSSPRWARKLLREQLKNAWRPEVKIVMEAF